MIKIAAAQIAPITGDIEQNIEKHFDLIKQAALQGADLVFFPELSITGYEPSLAHELALSPDDPNLEVFLHLSDAHQLVIGIGLPTSSEQGTHISMLFFLPGQDPVLYSKQHLHPDELPFFVPGTAQLVLEVKGFVIAPAICYESLLLEHAVAAVQAGAQIYLVSVAKSAQGLSKAQAHYSQLVKDLSLDVVMANAVGPSDNFISVGGSAAWGQCTQALGEEKDVLMCLELEPKSSH
jgi:predicted amidohydrolase